MKDVLCTKFLWLYPSVVAYFIPPIKGKCHNLLCVGQIAPELEACIELPMDFGWMLS